MGDEFFGIDFNGLSGSERGNVVGQMFRQTIAVMTLVGDDDLKTMTFLAHEMRQSGIPCVILATDQSFAPKGTHWLVPDETRKGS